MVKRTCNHVFKFNVLVTSYEIIAADVKELAEARSFALLAARHRGVGVGGRGAVPWPHGRMTPLYAAAPDVSIRASKQHS